MIYAEQHFNDNELQHFLERLLTSYHSDFRHYKRSTLNRAFNRALRGLKLTSLEALQEFVFSDTRGYLKLLSYLAISTSEMFRDPLYFQTFRERVLPVLRTYASLKFWICGCSTGEEAYSTAIVLHECGLLDRSLIYATDINPQNLKRAEAGVYGLEQMSKFATNYQASGGKLSFENYYAADSRGATVVSFLKKRVVFADHSLATDHVFSEVQYISCRNVLIYFDQVLRERAYALFAEALVRHGFLGLGVRERILPAENAQSFEPFDMSAKIFRKNFISSKASARS